MNGSSGGAPDGKQSPVGHSYRPPTATDGGDRFHERVDELYQDAIEEVDDPDPAETMVYARCCAAAEIAANDLDVPLSNVLGVMTAAVREAAEQGGFAFEDVLDQARDVHVEVSE